MGVGFNFVFAFLILLFIGLIFGAPSTEPVINDVTEGYPAEQAGIEKGDEVLRINGHKVSYLEDISLYLTVEDLSKTVTFEVKKSNGELATYLKADINKGIGDSIVYAFNEECAMFKQMFVVIANLFTGGVHLNQLSGPVGIYSIVGQMSEQGVSALLYLTALLSINVGVINLLPFPAFDGGRILFLIIEKIKGSPVDPKIENTIHSIGFILLILLMIYVTFNDILKLF